MSVVRRFLFLLFPLFLLFSSPSHATDYSWMFNFAVGPYKSATEGCAANGWPEAVNWYYGAAYGICQRARDNGDGTTTMVQGPPITRTGDSCPVGTVYNSVTGGCASDNKCSSLKDTELSAFRWESNTDDPPSTISNDGCEASVTQARCSYVSSGKAVCTGRATYTGNKLDKNPKGNVADCSGSSCTEGSPQPETKNQDCVYSSDGSGSSSCTATNSQSNPGTSQCGSVNGTYTCIENPKATATSSTLNSTKTPTSNANGTLTIVQDDTVTTVKCSGRSCTSTSSSSHGTTVTNSSGQVISHDSTCTGKSCGSSGQVSTGGSGNGTGDAEEGDDGDSPSAGKLVDPTNGSFDGQGDDWDSKIEKAKKEYKDGIDKIKDSFKPMGDVSIGGGSKLYCPPAVTVLGKNIDFCLDKYASSLSWISDAILALCAMIALIIVFT
jgi:hypothetical protein